MGPQKSSQTNLRFGREGARITFSKYVPEFIFLANNRMCITLHHAISDSMRN